MSYMLRVPSYELRGWWGNFQLSADCLSGLGLWGEEGAGVGGGVSRGGALGGVEEG
jgi:hypothetical protein